MNIFATNKRISLAAKDLDDRRRNKMIIETCQMLCTAMNESGLTSPYKSTHSNHPCTKWVKADVRNFAVLTNYLELLHDGYRTHTGRTHASYDKCMGYFTDVVDANVPPHIMYNNCNLFENVPNCSLYKDISDVYEAYRLTMYHKWTRLDKTPPKWNGSTENKPTWYCEVERLYGDKVKEIV